MQREYITANDHERTTKDALLQAVRDAQASTGDPLLLRERVGRVRQLEGVYQAAVARKRQAESSWHSHRAIVEGVAAVEDRGRHYVGQQVGEVEGYAAQFALEYATRLDDLERRVAALEARP